jgi:hypothetical protein
MFRKQGLNYGDIRTAQSLRVQHSLAFGAELSLESLDAPKKDDDDELGAGVIAGIVIGSVAGVVVLAIGGTWAHRRVFDGKIETGGHTDYSLANWMPS